MSPFFRKIANERVRAAISFHCLFNRASSIFKERCLFDMFKSSESLKYNVKQFGTTVWTRMFILHDTKLYMQCQ